MMTLTTMRMTLMTKMVAVRQSLRMRIRVRCLLHDLGMTFRAVRCTVSEFHPAHARKSAQGAALPTEVEHQ
eukprot:1147024-Amphidinium_carterae.1